MLVCHLDALLLAEGWIIPIEIINLKLHELCLGIRLNELLELLRGAVGREADVLGETALFDALHELPRIVFLKSRRPVATKIVHEIDIEIIDTEIRE